MKINENDITKILADLPEMNLPEGFHDEVMLKIKGAREASGRPQRRPIMHYIGPLVAAAALVFIMVAMLDFGQTNMGHSSDMAPAPIAAMAEVEQAEPEAWATPSIARTFDDDFYGFYDATYDFEWLDSTLAIAGGGLQERFGLVDDTVTFLGGTLEEQFEIAGFPANIISHMFFPDHLPTDSLYFETEYRFVITFEIVILVEDLVQATHALHDLGSQPPVMALQPAFEDLEATFTALYALGTVESYTMTITDGWALMINDPEGIAPTWEAANTINVIFIE